MSAGVGLVARLSRQARLSRRALSLPVGGAFPVDGPVAVDEPCDRRDAWGRGLWAVPIDGPTQLWAWWLALP